jgi:hypothetical protein
MFQFSKSMLYPSGRTRRRGIGSDVGLGLIDDEVTATVVGDPGPEELPLELIIAAIMVPLAVINAAIKTPIPVGVLH